MNIVICFAMKHKFKASITNYGFVILVRQFKTKYYSGIYRTTLTWVTTYNNKNMELEITNLTIVAEMKDGKHYVILPKKETSSEILKLIVEKEGHIPLFDKPLENFNIQNNNIL